MKRGVAKGRESQYKGKLERDLMALYLEFRIACGEEECREMLAIKFKKSREEVARILSSRTFINLKIREYRSFLGATDDATLLLMAKQLFLNPDTKAGDKSRFLEKMDEIIKQRGSGKVWKLREVGDRGDKELKTYTIGQEEGK